MAQTDTRRRILDVALACFLADGYEQTTIAAIRKRSGTSNGALFHHFPSKEAIAGALYLEAIASFQQGLWELVSHEPRSLRDAVRAVLEHQLTWTERNADLARFIYARGHLDWDTAAGTALAARNRDLAAAFRQWMTPLVASGEIRPRPMLLTTAIVSGPAHSIAQRWLAGHLDRPLTSFLDELTGAACAGLSGATPAGVAGEPVADGPPPAHPAATHRTTAHPATAHPAAATARVTVDLLADDGSVVGRGQALARLSP
jgi:AcrR family transcriptional regulator